MQAFRPLPIFDPIPGVFELVVNDKFSVPSYVEEGMRVIAPYIDDGQPKGLHCKVLVAAGLHARVVNEQYKFDQWFAIEHLRIKNTP